MSRVATRDSERRRRQRPPRSSPLGLVLGLLYMPAAIATIILAPYDVSGAVIWGTVLAVGTIPKIRAWARSIDDPAIGRLVTLALVLKLAAALVRWYVAQEFYGGNADATQYIREGERLARSYRLLDFDADLGRAFIGTGSVRFLTGTLFTLIGKTDLGAYVVFAWFGFVGLWLFYRAFRVALPDGRHRRYAHLLFFLPSLLYWPSSVGKEAWVMMCLGAATLGAARLLTRESGALVPLLLGVTGVLVVRPHVAALFIGGAGVALLFRREGERPISFGKVALLLVIATVGIVTLRSVEERFGLEEEGVAGIGTVVDEAARRTGQGGSEFEAEQVESAADLPTAAVAVLFRPFPWEAHNLQALATSFEGLFLLLLFAANAGRLARLPRQMLTRPYLLLTILYSLGFIIAFSSFGNFGILARQRTQLFPYVLVLLALDVTSGRQRRRASR